jgi:hypothetical protein
MADTLKARTGAVATVAFLAIQALGIGICLADVTSSRVAALAYLIAQQTGNGNWQPAEGQEVPATSEALNAFLVSGMGSSAPFARGAAWLANADTPSIDSLARKIVSLKQASMATAVLDATLLNSKSYSSGYVWGSYKGYGASYPDIALGLKAHRAANGGYGDLTQLGVAVYCEVLRSQRSDGGWSYSSKPSTSGASDPSTAYSSSLLPTAYTLLELNEIQQSTGWTTGSTCGTSYNLSSALTNSLNFIWSKRNSDGGFGDNANSSALETTLAYRVIRKLAPTDSRGTDALNWLVTHQNANGSWPGGSFVTAAVLASLDSATLADTDHDGIPDAVELLLGTNPNVADARYLAKGNGQAVSGLTVPVALANEITLGKPFSFTLPAYGGTTPYIWKMGSGSLPTGLNLNTTTGVISGTPTRLGDFSFTYIATDSASPPATQETLGRISVYVSPPSLADGDINGDGVVDVADFRLAERFALGSATPSPYQAQHADVFPIGAPDGVIDIRDAILIRSRALGLQ